MTDNIFSEILDNNSPSNSWLSLPVSPLDDKTTGMQVPCPPFSILSFIAFLVYFFIQFISFLDTDVVAAFSVRLEHFYIVNWFLTSLLKSPLLICKLAHRLFICCILAQSFSSSLRELFNISMKSYFLHIYVWFLLNLLLHAQFMGSHISYIFMHSFYWIYCHMYYSCVVTFLTY